MKKDLESKTQKGAKMKKYIVEVPEPREGQKISSGGVRENGKLAAQFKNPVPYEEPLLPPAVSNRNVQERALRNEACRYMLIMAWQELGEPVLRSCFRKFGDMMVDRIESTSAPKAQHSLTSEAHVIDILDDDPAPSNSDDKIIHFTDRKAI